MRPTSLVVLILTLGASVATSRDPGYQEDEQPPPPRVHVYSARRALVEVRYADPVRCEVLEAGRRWAGALAFPEEPSVVLDVLPEVPEPIRGPEQEVPTCFAMELRSGRYTAVVFVDSTWPIDDYRGERTSLQGLRRGAIVLSPGEGGGFLDGGVGLVQDPDDLGICDAVDVTWPTLDLVDAVVSGVEERAGCTAVQVQRLGEPWIVCGTSLPVREGDVIDVFGDADVFSLDVHGGPSMELGRDLGSLGTVLETSPVRLACAAAGACGTVIEADSLALSDRGTIAVGEPVAIEGHLLTLLELRTALMDGCPDEGVFRLDP